jgi:hypothetical protein
VYENVFAKRNKWQADGVLTYNIRSNVTVVELVFNASLYFALILSNRFAINELRFRNLRYALQNNLDVIQRLDFSDKNGKILNARISGGSKSIYLLKKELKIK